MESNNNNNSLSKIKPFLIGISGGSASGKTSVVKEVSKLLINFEICTISLDSYYKNLTKKEYERISEYNFDEPNAFDFDLIVEHIIALRNGESIEMPKYDFVTSKRLSVTQTVKSTPVIIFEGILTFYNKQIRNLMDLKIFIDTDCDVRLSRRIFRDIKERGRDLKIIIDRYHQFVKPAYENYIGPTKKYADIIIPRGASNEAAIQIVSEYLKLQLNKIINRDNKNLFSSINEIIDPKYQFYHKKVLVVEEPSQIDFIKLIFEDVIKGEEEPEFIQAIRDKMISIIPNTLIEYFRTRETFSKSLPKIDLIITENDDIANMNISNAKNILLYKTCILTEKDMEIPKEILKRNTKCQLVINTIFLASKFADLLLLQHKIDTIIFNTIYFSDFFIKYEQMIKESKGTYDKSILGQKFKEMLYTELHQ